MTRAAIVTCAVTGSIHTPSMSPYLPITVADVISAAVGAVEAGASIVHLHVRDPLDGRPSADPELYLACVAGIRALTDAVINVTTGGSSLMTLEERLRGPLRVEPEMASLNMGSMNFGLFPMAARARDWRFDWERPFLIGSRDGLFRNTFADIDQILDLSDRFGTRFEFECYDVGHLYTLAHFVDAGRVRSPLFVQMVFGILGGIGADLENLDYMHRIAMKLFGTDLEWSVLGAGRAQMDFVGAAAAMDGNVRVGLEDNLWTGPGRLSESNAEQVSIARDILTKAGRTIASPAEARARLGLATA